MVAGPEALYFRRGEAEQYVPETARDFEVEFGEHLAPESISKFHEFRSNDASVYDLGKWEIAKLC